MGQFTSKQEPKPMNNYFNTVDDIEEQPSISKKGTNSTSNSSDLNSSWVSLKGKISSATSSF
jgi:hypothetical protein